jgi:hypothetical protein
MIETDISFATFEVQNQKISIAERFGKTSITSSSGLRLTQIIVFFGKGTTTRMNPPKMDLYFYHQGPTGPMRMLTSLLQARFGLSSGSFLHRLLGSI